MSFIRMMMEDRCFVLIVDGCLDDMQSEDLEV